LGRQLRRALPWRVAFCDYAITTLLTTYCIYGRGFADSLRRATNDLPKSNLHVWWMGSGCFGIVIYNENRNLGV
jgi:hypothetical protein